MGTGIAVAWVVALGWIALANGFSGRVWESGAETSPTRALIVSIDNRELSWDVKEPHYPTQTNIINRDYAVHNQYDFLYLRNEVATLVPRVKALYPQAAEDPMMKTEQVAKDVATGFNVHLQQYRAASWAKLPALWNITVAFKGKYDYIWYIDSDAAISPWQFNRSIAQAIDQWASAPDAVLRGQRDVRNSTFLFFSNFPWRDDMPCAGSFIFRPTDEAERVLRQWWDFDLASKNFKHFHEQDALWHMIEHPERGFFMNERVFSVLRERQFPSAFARYEDLWLIHIASYNFALRVPVLAQCLRVIKRNINTDTYQDAVDLLHAYHIYPIDPLQVAQAMEAANLRAYAAAGAAPRIESWPAHDLAKQSEWYDQHVSSRSLAPPGLGSQLEGRLVRFRKEFFLIDREAKRPFASYDAYLQLKLGDDYALALSRHEYSNLPTGAPIGVDLPVDERARLLRFYTPLPDVNLHGQGHYRELVNEFQAKFDRKSHKPVPDHRDCLLDSELQTLMLTGNSTRPRPLPLPTTAVPQPPKVKMFIIGHNSEALSIAKGFAYCKDAYMQILPIPSTPFFESIVYASLLPQILRYWFDPARQAYLLDYVVLGTYKTVGKSLHYNSYTQSLTNVRVLLRHMYASPELDVAPFLRSGSAFLPFALYFHGPPFQTAWDLLLRSMGYDQALIRGFDQHKQIFFRNIYIIKPRVLQELCQFMQLAMNITSGNPEVRKAFAVDAKYKEGEVEVARRIFGTDYYHLHPFVFERLPSFFFYAKGVRVCAGDSGPCKYNS